MITIKSMSNIREAKDGRKFYVVGAIDSLDPFATKLTKRTVFQQFTAKSDETKQFNDINPAWVGGDPAVIAGLIKSGQAVKGDVVTAQVPEYEVADRTASTYSTIVFASENYKTVFKNAGHPIEETAAIPAMAEAAEPELV